MIFIFSNLPDYAKDDADDASSTSSLPYWLTVKDEAGPLDIDKTISENEAGPLVTCADAGSQTEDLQYYRHVPPPPVR